MMEQNICLWTSPTPPILPAAFLCSPAGNHLCFIKGSFFFQLLKTETWSQLEPMTMQRPRFDRFSFRPWWDCLRVIMSDKWYMWYPVSDSIYRGWFGLSVSHFCFVNWCNTRLPTTPHSDVIHHDGSVWDGEPELLQITVIRRRKKELRGGVRNQGSCVQMSCNIFS